MATTAERHVPVPRSRKNGGVAANLASTSSTTSEPEPRKEEAAACSEFVWAWGGKDVSVAGSWNNWTPIPMIYDQITRTHRLWVRSLPKGRVSYKFIIDGSWRYDGSKPLTHDDFGNVNNLLEL